MEWVFIDRKGNKVVKPEGKKVNNRLSVYGIAKQGNKILLIKPIWKEEFELPGGGIEKNENIYEGLKREFLEETGYPINVTNNSPIKVKSVFFYADDIDTFFVSNLLFFLVKVVGKKEPSLVNKSEINQCGWYELRELKENNMKINKLHSSVIKKSEVTK